MVPRNIYIFYAISTGIASHRAVRSGQYNSNLNFSPFYNSGCGRCALMRLVQIRASVSPITFSCLRVIITRLIALVEHFVLHSCSPAIDIRLFLLFFPCRPINLTDICAFTEFRMHSTNGLRLSLLLVPLRTSMCKPTRHSPATHLPAQVETLLVVKPFFASSGHTSCSC